MQAAKRELYEESGAVQYGIVPMCDYWAGEPDMRSGAGGVVFAANISRLGPMPVSEMQEVRAFCQLPENLTYPSITPVLFRELEMKSIQPGDFEKVELWDAYNMDGTITDDVLLRNEYP